MMPGRKKHSVQRDKYFGEEAWIRYFRQKSLNIIIIIKRGWQCKAEREWYTPYQSEDPSPAIPTYRQKEEKGKNSRRP